MQLTFDDILVNASVQDKDVLRLVGKTYAMYQRLLQGPATTLDLLFCEKGGIICPFCGYLFMPGKGTPLNLMYNSRINELRHLLVNRQQMIDQADDKNGGHIYRIVPIERSSFWAKVKEKGEEWKWM